MSDIKKINGKYYDFSERNATFTLTASELQNLGIKNYYFMLRINNPRVADIDPFNPHITKQEIEALLIEYSQNMWWFARTAVRMRTDKGIVEFGLHRGLAAALWCFERNQDFCLNEPRQTWKTTGTLAGPVQWAFQLSSNLKCHFFGKETDNTKRNLATLKDDIDLLPEWLQFKQYMGSDGKVKKTRQSTETLHNNLQHNSIETHPKPASLSHAQGMGRGGSGAILYFDEIEHTPFFSEILANSAPLFKTASENAAAAGKPYCRICTTTPGNLDTREGRDAFPVIQSMIPWTEKIYDMTDEEIENYKSAFKAEYHNGPNQKTREVINMFYLEYQYYQVRKDHQWVLDQYALSGDKMAIRREILLQRLRGSSESPIAPEDIEYLISNMKKSDRDLLICGKWRFRLYDHGQGYRYGVPQDFDRNIPYLVGIDPAAGGGGDNFAITIVNPYNLKIAAEFKSPYLGGTAAVQMLVELVREHIPKAVLIPEQNSMGIYLIQMICDQTSIKENLYWSETTRQLDDMVEESEEDYELKSLAVKYKKFGTYMTGKVRKGMIELLFKHLNECKELLLTEYLVDDICKLVKTSTGRIEAVKGEHDDNLFSYLHVLHVYYNGDNLEYFGIIKAEHPITGPVELDLDKHLMEMDTTAGFFSTKQVSFDEYCMEEAARMEEEDKMMVEKFSFISHDVYSKRKERGELQNETVSIHASFFDEMNGYDDYDSNDNSNFFY